MYLTIYKFISIRYSFIYSYTLDIICIFKVSILKTHEKRGNKILLNIKTKQKF